jgi:hypothetical protein
VVELTGEKMAEAKAELKSTKAPAPKSSGGFVATVGGNLSDGSRFEAGDKLGSLKPNEIKALKEMGAIAEDK